MSKMTDKLKEWILKFNSGEVWVNVITNEETQRQYLGLFKRYCDATNKNPDELLELKLEGMRNVGTNKEFEAENLHNTAISNIELTDNLKAQMSAIIRSFYKHNRRPLNTPKEFEVPTLKQRMPSLQEIEEMVNVARTWRDKSMIWLLTSAPLREGTLIQLIWDDLQPTGDEELPYIINIEAERLKGKGKGKYKGVRQVCFVNSFVAEKLDKYKAELLGKNIRFTPKSPIFVGYRNGNGKKKEPKKAKALSPSAIRTNFAKISFDAWHNLENKRYSPHNFRDLVETAMEKADIPDNWCAIIMGHKPKTIRGKHYSSPKLEELKNKFKRVLPFIIPTHKQQAPTKERLQESYHFMTNVAWQLIEMQYKNLKQEAKTLKALMENAKSEETRNVLEVQLTMKKEQLQQLKKQIDFKRENNKYPPPERNL